jgi:hypothetical protein
MDFRLAPAREKNKKVITVLLFRPHGRGPVFAATQHFCRFNPRPQRTKTMKRSYLVAALFAVLTFIPNLQAALITIDWVTVGDPGNTADTTSYGAVADSFQIMKFEFQNSQYADFLNAVDPTGTNPNSVYNTNMGSDARGGISFTSGAASGSKYAIRTNMGDKPVNYVSWFDAARVANWLQNGQGSGSTETGAYTLSGADERHGPGREPGSVVFSSDGRPVVQGGVLQGRRHERGLLGLRHAERHGPHGGDGGFDRNWLRRQHGQLRELHQRSRLEQPKRQRDDGGHQWRSERLRCL